MRETWKTAKVGMLVVFALVATYGVYRFVDERAGGQGGYGVWALFDDAQGLVPKSRVLIAGIQVGYIEKISLSGDQARVDVHINDGVALYEGALVQKRTASLLGEAILVLDPGAPGPIKLKNGSRIQTARATAGTDQIMNDVAEVAKSVRAITGQMERVFGSQQGGDQMAAALKNLSESLERINGTIATNQEVITRTLANVEDATARGGPELVEALDNVQKITDDVRQIVLANRESVNSGLGQVGDTVSSIRRASEQLEAVLGDVRQVTQRTAEGEGTLGRLTADERLVDEVEGVAEGVNNIVGGISRLQTIVGLRSEYNFFANTLKSYVSLRIQPGEDRYYLIELINDPRGLTEFEQTTVRTSPAPEGTPQTYNETRIRTRDAFRFSLMLAKRIHFATLRYGILESTGGMGLDLHLFDDRLEITTDLFAFGEQSAPRLRIKLAAEVIRKLWLLGGIDDTLNDSRDFFFGAMLRFNDDDLKSILPFAGSLGGGM